MESDRTNVYGALSQRRIGYGVRCAKRVSRWVDEGFSWGFWDSRKMPLEEGVMGKDYSRLTSLLHGKTEYEGVTGRTGQDIPSEDLDLHPVGGDQRAVTKRKELAEVCATPEEVLVVVDQRRLQEERNKCLQ